MLERGVRLVSYDLRAMRYLQKVSYRVSLARSFPSRSRRAPRAYRGPALEGAGYEPRKKKKTHPTPAHSGSSRQPIA